MIYFKGDKVLCDIGLGVKVEGVIINSHVVSSKKEVYSQYESDYFMFHVLIEVEINNQKILLEPSKVEPL